jgi:hypothetical protein
MFRRAQSASSAELFARLNSLLGRALAGLSTVTGVIAALLVEPPTHLVND